MPVNDFQSPFERIVLTQAAINARNEMGEWLKKKEQAVQAGNASEPDLDKGSKSREIAENLYRKFVDYHKIIFKYASRYNKLCLRAGDNDGAPRVFQIDQLEGRDLDNLKRIFEIFVCACYDASGKLKISNVDAAANKMQWLYETLKTANHGDAENFIPLRYLRFPASLIITQLGSGEKWAYVAPQGINFNRGDKPFAGLESRFRQAVDGSLDAVRDDAFTRLNNPSAYVDHHESFELIAGYRFPCLTFDHRTHLITDTGYTVELTNALRVYILMELKKGGRADNLKIPFTPLDENPSDPATLHLSTLIQEVRVSENVSATEMEWAADVNKVLGRLRESLQKMATSPAIDGRQVKSGEALLVSMDIDLLTGLSLKEGVQSETARLGAFISTHAKAMRGNIPDDLIIMSDFLALFPEPGSTQDYRQHIADALQRLAVIAQEQNNDDIVELIAAAASHIQAIIPCIMESVGRRFMGKPTAGQLKQQPRFFMTMGGVAAGKSNADKIALEECGESKYVVAELDGARWEFDRQAINVATDNHNFDYKNIEQAGKLVRAMVIERARYQGYHLLLDGSGIPYENRFAPIVKAFKKKGYNTNVLGFDRTLYAYDPEKRMESQGKVLGDVLYHQGVRIGRELRAVPVKIIASNYALVPEALLQASQDQNVDRFWLIDNNPCQTNAGNHSYSHPYILSFTAEVTQKQLTLLDTLQGAALKEAIIGLAQENEKIREVMHHERYRPDDTLADNWNFKVVGRIGDCYRIEVITDADRYIGTLQKGLFNSDANGPEELFKLTRPMSWDIEGLFLSDRHALRVQPDKYISVNEWPVIPCATAYSTLVLLHPGDRRPENTSNHTIKTLFYKRIFSFVQMFRRIKNAVS